MPVLQISEKGIGNTKVCVRFFSWVRIEVSSVANNTAVKRVDFVFIMSHAQILFDLLSQFYTCCCASPGVRVLRNYRL